MKRCKSFDFQYSSFSGSHIKFIDKSPFKVFLSIATLPVVSHLPHPDHAVSHPGQFLSSCEHHLWVMAHIPQPQDQILWQMCLTALDAETKQNSVDLTSEINDFYHSSVFLPCSIESGTILVENLMAGCISSSLILYSDPSWKRRWWVQELAQPKICECLRVKDESHTVLLLA